MISKKTAYLGVLIAVAFIFSYIEFLIPINFGIPGIKLGLANLVVIIALYTLGEGMAFSLSIIRIILVGFTFGNLSAMLYSFAGGIVSFLVMVLAKKSGLFSEKGVGILGGVFHNVGQILVAMVVLETTKLIYYMPALMVSGTISGTAIGTLASSISVRVQHSLKYLHE